MKLRSALMSSVAVAALLVGAALSAPAHADRAGPSPASTGDARAALAARWFASTQARHSADRALVESIRADLPADWISRVDAVRERLGLRPSAGELALRARVAGSVGGRAPAAAPGQYQCGPTPLTAYINSLYDEIGPSTVNTLSLLGAFDLPFIDAELNGTQPDPRYAIDPAYRSRVVVPFEKEKTFWAIPLTDVQLVGVHGTLLTDTERTAALLVELGIEPKVAQRVAAKVAALVERNPALQDGDNPLFSFGAEASDGSEAGDDGVPRVLMGDGLLAAATALGFARSGPQIVIAHEMGHQLQFAAGIPNEEDTFANGRRVELEADGFGGYFLAHKRGLGFSPPRLAGAAFFAYDSGDCRFGIPGSHGTPNQRRAAVQWGVAEVAYASDPTVVATAAALDRDFTRALRVILLPDADPTPEDFKALVAS